MDLDAQKYKNFHTFQRGSFVNGFSEKISRVDELLLQPMFCRQARRRLVLQSF